MKVAVIGAGRVGVISALVLVELGHELTLVDVDSDRVARLRAGAMPFFEPGADAALRAAARSGRWMVTGREEDTADADVVLIAVPTPSGADGHYDLAALQAAVNGLRRVAARAGAALRWRAIFLRSTVLPGTTQRLLADAPCPVGFLPEFLREGSALSDARQPDRIVVGADDPAAAALARALFAGLATTFFDTGIRTAELIKTANNALLSTCVSFANELTRLAARIEGVEAMDVFDALHLDRRLSAPSRAGIADYLLPGPGFGGSCLAKDLAALTAFARGEQLATPMLDAALHINRSQPAWFVARIDRALGGLSGRSVLVLGLAFKPETDDMRDSIALPILRELAARGAAVRAHDPAVDDGASRARLAELGVADLVDGAFEAAFDAADAVVLVTPWPRYLEALPALLARRATPLLFADARGALRAATRAPSVTYLGVGTHLPEPEA
ncbi:nucleotide sugar dehydrogenase [bacterium]|nr:nucleotide sugar dehydrogenase [bacterium]